MKVFKKWAETKTASKVKALSSKKKAKRVEKMAKFLNQRYKKQSLNTLMGIL